MLAQSFTYCILAFLGIVFFLFEVGLELSMEKLRAMRKDVFGLGTSQFLLTTAAISSFAISRGLSPAGTIHSFTHSST